MVKKVSMENNVGIIGGGPAGLLSAIELTNRGVNSIVFEEHSEIGDPPHCSGLISLNGFRKIGINPFTRSARVYLQNIVKGAIFSSSIGTKFEIESSKPVAAVINRSAFDKYLAYHYMKKGGEIYTSSPVIDVKQASKTIDIVVQNRLKKDTKVFSFSVIVDAEGISKKIRKKLGINWSHRILPAYQMEVYGIEVDPDFVELYFDRRLAKDFFGWVIPLEEKRARVGLATSNGNPRDNLRLLLKRPDLKARYKELNIEKEYGGGVITSGALPKTYGNRFVLVGDAAGHVKPTTGGGVVLGGIGSRIAAKVISESVHKSKISQRTLKHYENLWKAEFGRELQFMLFIRKLLNHLSNKHMDILFRNIKDSGINKVVSEKGDMDFQYKMIKDILTDSQVAWKLFVFLIKSILFL
ncbi:MAG: geranylgeranyl reductase family protein [Candidatus Asgardarchaeia archaeon]